MDAPVALLRVHLVAESTALVTDEGRQRAVAGVCMTSGVSARPDSHASVMTSATALSVLSFFGYFASLPARKDAPGAVANRPVTANLVSAGGWSESTGRKRRQSHTA